MTCAERRRLRHIAKRGPVINMTVTAADRALFDAGLITADRNAVYVSLAGIAWLALEECR